jgi:hypothetical protein
MSLTYHRQPTLQNARIRTVQDALQVFFAVARNALTMLTRRLDADERKAIRSGNVYIWEDRSSSTVDNGGLTMERWCVRLSPRPFALRAILLIRPPPPSLHHQDRRNVMGAIAHTRGWFPLSPALNPFGHLSLVETQEFLFYYQRDLAQERLPTGGG